MKRFTALLLVSASLFLGACRQEIPAPEAAASLEGSAWTLTQLSDSTVPLSGNAFLRFGGKKEPYVTGSGGCNRFRGNYVIEGHKIRIGPLISTRMACPNMREERAFFDALQTADAYRLNKGSLVLLRHDKPLLRFEAKTRATPSSEEDE
jgi:heat shock protein HslJ